ncbi:MULTISPECIES: lactonase family protein [Bacillus]|uniref:6-phosphogluconolactonase n=2 Tax=Bacillus TaxID=1386 RepID=A0A0M4G697_9BACI|nr:MULTISPECIES: lactonase family protein [Bacillus]ALC80370.1 6-phosphogluconolactonase [Bacillus gobiensis]MBP1083783.1 6-phosphogluconolactonase [Bacillus capparidis]MED1098268.1 lactonase family protein [Bacillus capparidis]
MAKYIGYVGTYTKGDSEGIYTFELDTEKARLSEPKLAAKLDGPTYVNISKDNQMLYSVIKEGDRGGVAAYRVDAATGELSLVNNQISDGGSPCHVSVDSEKKYVVSANYHSGTIVAYQVNEDGSLNPATSFVTHEGRGPNEDRQERAHAHFAGFTPDEKYVVSVDLGIDKLVLYQLINGLLSEVTSHSFTPGSGPRHIEFHPNEKYAYVFSELSNEVAVLAYNPEPAEFQEIQIISTLPEGFNENSQGSAIHVTKDGNFVYAANRGHDSIAVFQVNPSSGKLSFVERVSTEGHWPRDFAFDPTEKFLIASNQETGTLALFTRDIETGKLELVQKDVPAPYAVCVKFLNY